MKDETTGACYRARANWARRQAQITQEEADVSEGFQRSALLDYAIQLRRQAERFDSYADQEEAR